MSKPDNPLTSEDKQKLLKLPMAIEEAQQQIDLANKAGIDTTIMQAELDKAKLLHQQIVDVYLDDTNFKG